MSPFKRFPCKQHRTLLLLLATTAALSGGCERKSPETKESPTTRKAATTAPAGAGAPAGPAAKLSSFTPPKLSDVERRALPMSIDMKIASAYHTANNALEDQPRTAALSRLAALYFAHGFPSQAAECLERIAELQPQDSAWRHGAGLAREKAGAQPEAIREFERAIAIRQDYEASHVHLADLVAAYDPAHAAQLYQHVLELNPTSARACYGLGRAAVVQGRPDEALKHFRRAVGFAPRYAEAHRALADVLKANGRPTEAEKHLRWAKAGGLLPGPEDAIELAMLRVGLDPQTLCNDAAFLARQRQFDQAEEIINTARQAGASETQVGLALGAVRALQGRADDASAEFRRVLQGEPDSDAAKFNLGQVLADSGQTAEAESVFRELLARRPDDIGTLERFGSLMSRLGKADEAVRLVQQALDADPENATLHYALAQFLVSAKREAEVIEHLRKAVELRPEYIAARHALAIALNSQGDRAAAKAEWQQALQINPKLGELYLALVSIAQAEKNPREMERLLRQGLQQLPDSPILANGLAWILATSSDAAQRKGPEAVEWAEKACKATNNAQHTLVDTLAAAYAEAGRFDDAVKAARQAVELATKAGDTTAADKYRARLALYQQSKVYHESE